MAQAQNEGLTNEEFTEMTGCIAVIHESSCVGKDGKTYSYAEPR